MKKSILRTVMTPFTGTLWADGFSEAKFAEVKALLGAPLKEWCGSGGCVWLYNWQDTPTADYDERAVSFDSLWRVNGFRHRFYID